MTNNWGNWFFLSCQVQSSFETDSFVKDLNVFYWLGWFFSALFGAFLYLSIIVCNYLIYIPVFILTLNIRPQGSILGNCCISIRLKLNMQMTQYSTLRKHLCSWCCYYVVQNQKYGRKPLHRKPARSTLYTYRTAQRLTLTQCAAGSQMQCYWTQHWGNWLSKQDFEPESELTLALKAQWTKDIPVGGQPASTCHNAFHAAVRFAVKCVKTIQCLCITSVVKL